MAGMKSISIGALLGLADFRKDAFLQLYMEITSEENILGAMLLIHHQESDLVKVA